MYIFIDSHTIIPYNDEILKRFVGNRLVKTIANPTDEQLREFGYKPMTEDEEPQYDHETQYLEPFYEETADEILKHYEVKDIPQGDEEFEEEILND